MAVRTNANAISPLKILAQKLVAAAGGDERARTIPEKRMGAKNTFPTRARSGIETYVISNAHPSGFASRTEFLASFVSIRKYKKSISTTSRSPM